MNKRGSITVESVIVVSTFIVVLSFLFQLMLLPSKEDISSQQIFDSLNELDNYSYAYEKIGLMEIKDQLHIISPYKKYVDDIFKYGNHLAKKEYLKLVFKHLLKENIEIVEFDLEEDIIKGRVSYNRRYIFEERNYEIEFEKKLFLFGDNRTLFPNKTLASVMKDALEGEENSVLVYKTKTGSKYHKSGCFYLERLTTDKKNITAHTLLEAEKMGLKPCKRCCKGD